ncbi:MAG: hypothetical protein RR523_15905 [Cetobacterium sp.]|uniref:hypothetical protein n=1 Tax=Cetobacterium sp. TaxID=2071632 RepID=UPI002FC8602A
MSELSGEVITIIGRIGILICFCCIPSLLVNPHSKYGSIIFKFGVTLVFVPIFNYLVEL